MAASADAAESKHSHNYRYISGFGASVESEALPDALPKGQNNPQICPYGLYAEQLSGTAFTAPRHKNQRSWLYRIRPSAMHTPFAPVDNHKLVGDFTSAIVNPNQLRWRPFSHPEGMGEVDWVDSLVTLAGSGDCTTKGGLAVHIYTASKSMDKKSFYNSDGDMLIVPQQGTLNIQTEFGWLEVAPNEIVVIPRGVKMSVKLAEFSRGYILEIFKGHFELPGLGPIGANGLANPRDFYYPTAAFEDVDEEHVVVNKYGGQLFSANMGHSPFDVVAWHGNYSPYKYDLERFCCINSVTFDHPDPSIYTVLTAASDEPGTALADFVIFPPRWMVMENTFRPPWYHRNCMSEFMGMVYGKYDAKEGFAPGGASLHSCMTAHGPDTDTFFKASTAELAPHKFEGGLAFMFETSLILKLTPYALETQDLEREYFECWQQLPKVFDPSKRDVTKEDIRARQPDQIKS